VFFYVCRDRCIPILVCQHFRRGICPFLFTLW
jgi:hypothetical protein